MSATFRILGCGSSGGVPRVGNQWGKCDPSNPKNRRRRCSALIEKTTEKGTTRVLIDTSPDLRQQLLDADVSHLDAVVFTHDHADHTHGIDDLRVLALLGKKRVRVYYDAATRDTLNLRFGYCFKSVKPEYPPILEGHVIEPGCDLVIKGAGGKINLTMFQQEHGAIQSLGIRCGGLAYSSDVSDLPESAQQQLDDLDVWIVDALRYDYHPSHFSLKDALQWIDRLRPKRAFITHMHIDLDYDVVARETPEHVMPAHDGQVIPFNDLSR